VPAGGVFLDNIEGGEETFAFHDLLAEAGAMRGNFIKGEVHAMQDKHLQCRMNGSQPPMHLEGGAGRHGVGHEGSVMPKYNNQIRRVID
jgi:hypothetical protein